MSKFLFCALILCGSFAFADTKSEGVDFTWNVSSPTILLTTPEPTADQAYAAIDDVKAQCQNFFDGSYNKQSACKTTRVNPLMELMANPNLPHYFRATGICVVHIADGCSK